MRRKEKEITNKSEIEAIIKQCLVCRIAFNAPDFPYVIPLAFGYSARSIYFHTAKKGKKIDCITNDNRVCFEFENNIELKSDIAKACNWSFVYESVIGYGFVEEIMGPGDKEKALNHIMEHYSGKAWEISLDSINKTRVWKIIIDSMTGKRSL